MSAKMLEEVMLKFDRDHSGTLTWDEFFGSDLKFKRIPTRRNQSNLAVQIKSTPMIRHSVEVAEVHVEDNTRR